MEIPMILSEQLRKRRFKLGLTQRKMAELIGVNPRTIEQWESGDNNVSPKKRQKAAESYQISKSEIEKLCFELEKTKTQNRILRKGLNKKPAQTVIEEYSSSVIGDALFCETGVREVSIRNLRMVSRKGQGGKPKKFFIEQKRITF